MIVVRLNQPQFEYDIHSLVKAFYPAEDVKVFEIGTKEFESTMGMPECCVIFEDRNITFSICTRVDSEDLESTKVSNVRKNQITDVVELEEGEERPSVKCKLKHLLYSVLSSYTGKNLPWGSLTGASSSSPR